MVITSSHCIEPSHIGNAYKESKPQLKHGQQFGCNRVVCKVRKTQHHNPEFGHTQGEILKKPAKKSTLAFNGG
jgi:hypothetical protein